MRISNQTILMQSKYKREAIEVCAGLTSLDSMKPIRGFFNFN